MSSQSIPEIEEHRLPMTMWWPNNPRLPLVVYCGVLDIGPRCGCRL